MALNSHTGVELMVFKCMTLNLAFASMYMYAPQGLHTMNHNATEWNAIVIE